MSWNGVLRDVARAGKRAAKAQQSAARQAGRAAAQRRRQLLEQQKQYHLYAEAQRAAHEVAMFENYLDLIVSLHRDAWNPWDWAMVAQSAPPQLTHDNERAAHQMLSAYQPSLTERALGHDKAKWAELQDGVARAKHADMAALQQRHAEWEWHLKVARGVLAGDLQAYQTVVDHLSPFDELEDLGTRVEVATTAPWYLEAHVAVKSPDIVPKEEIKLTAGGKVSKKNMAAGKYWGLYQDHVCSAAIRVARELFALLPVKVVFAHTYAEAVNTATGHAEHAAIVSVAFEREKFLGLNFEGLDASDAVTAFGGVMKFKKTSGFAKVDVLVPGGWVSKG